MTEELSLILPYILAATGAGLIGGLVAVFWSPKVKMRSAIQHFAAGAVLAAVASTLIPEVEKIGNIAGIVIGFILGGLLMIGLKWLVLRFERNKKGKPGIPAGLAAAAGIDTVMDGIIIGVGFSAGQQLGVILAVALGIELLFLTLSVGSEFRKGDVKRWHGIAVTSGIALLLLAGALVATIFWGGLSPGGRAFILSLGAAALIYLIAEELLVENIEAEESLFSTITLFSGFLLLVVLKFWV